MPTLRISDIAERTGEEITLKGWVANLRSSGSIIFVQFRDGTGILQAIVSKKDLGEEAFQEAKQLTIESSLELTGTVQKDDRAPGGYEMQVQKLQLVHVGEEYPIGKKEHGVDFLMDHRHLWLRSPRQTAILRIRDEIVWQLRSWMRENGFVLTDTPILTPTSCEGTTTLFETDYFGEPAYLAQSGQLYLEASTAALGRAYDFGPTFRAEKSKTRRHLTEFWMLDAEAAFVDFVGNMEIQEQMISSVVQNVLKARAADFKLIERDTIFLEKVKAPFPRLRYDEAIVKLQALGNPIKAGDDIGADEEMLLTKEYDTPFFLTHFPAKIKGFYFQPEEGNSDRVLGSDLLAPEGYGEIIGGAQRIHDVKLLEQKMKEFKLPIEDYQWYLDLRRYGSFPHSGFGLGLERVVAWMCGLDHVRESIPFPRLLTRLRP